MRSWLKKVGELVSRLDLPIQLLLAAVDDLARGIDRHRLGVSVSPGKDRQNLTEHLL